MPSSSRASTRSTGSCRSGAARASTRPRRRICHHPRRAGHGLRQPAVRGREEATVAAQAAPGDPDDVRDGFGGDHGGGARYPRPQSQDGDLASVSATHAGDRRPGSVPLAAAGGNVVDRPRRGLSRRRVLPIQAFDTRARPDSPDDRPPYQGANPVADVWSAKALEFGGRYLRRAVADGDDVEARGFMMLAATMAGVGFGSAGVDIPMRAPTRSRRSSTSTSLPGLSR